MITFSCEKCGKTFSVDDKLAGRKGKCKACGSPIIVPRPQQLDSQVSDWLDDAVTAETAATAPAPTAPERAASSRSPSRQYQASDLLPPGAAAASGGTGRKSASGGGKASATKTGSRMPGGEQSPAAPKNKLPPRTRRLIADAQMIAKALETFPLIRVHKALGNPPELYQIIYNVRGLARGPDGRPMPRDGHVVEIQLTRDYPRQSPKCRMLTPIFHPNIEPATICVGDHWTAGERLVDLVIRIGEMITYQAYNIKSPLDGEAAMWADQNAQRLPVDRRDLHPPDVDW